MQILIKILKLYKNYHILKNLKWTKKGIFPYILYVIGILKYIINHPLYTIFKYIFNILFILEGVMLVLYYTGLPFTYDVSDIHNIFGNLYELLYNYYINTLKYIRDKINYLLNEKIIDHTENYEVICFNNDNEKLEIVNKEKIESNRIYWLEFGIALVIATTGFIIYYYYSDIINYFKGNNPPPDSNPSTSNIEIKGKSTEIINDLGKLEDLDESISLKTSFEQTPKTILTSYAPEEKIPSLESTPKTSIIELTPKASTSKLPEIKYASTNLSELPPSLAEIILNKINKADFMHIQSNIDNEGNIQYIIESTDTKNLSEITSKSNNIPKVGPIEYKSTPFDFKKAIKGARN